MNGWDPAHWRDRLQYMARICVDPERAAELQAQAEAVVVPARTPGPDIPPDTLWKIAQHASRAKSGIDWDPWAKKRN